MKGGRDRVPRSEGKVKRDNVRVPTNGEAARGTLRINGDGGTIFLDTSHDTRGRFTWTFSFLEEKDRRGIFLKLHLQHSLFRETVGTSNIPGDELHWLTEGEGEVKNSISWAYWPNSTRAVPKRLIL